MRKLKKELIEALLKEFKEQGLPKLPSEIAHYLKYGDKGPAMLFYTTYYNYLKDAFLEDVSKEEIATFALIEKITK